MNLEIKKLMSETDKQLKPLQARAKRYLIFVAILAVFVLALITVYKVNQFFENNKLVFQKPISINFFAPVYVAPREKIQTIKVVEQIKSNTPLNETQQYLCDKFGANCKIALAIQKAENGTGQCDRINWSNKDQSLDIGYMQINTLWINKNIFKPVQLFDCKSNIDAAYEIFKRWGGETDTNKGFGAWATYNNKSYLKFMY